MPTSFKVCVATGSRADYGLLSWVMGAIAAQPRLDLQVVATGAHLSPVFGRTISEIEADGFDVDAEVDCLLSGDSATAVAKSTGLALIGFADAFATLRPDFLLVLGDRYEILAAAQAAHLTRIPIGHIAGGDVTEGALDDAIRHMITKMASLHFVSHADAGRRVRQLGEAADRIFDVGHLGLDAIRRVIPLSRTELASSLGYSFRPRNLLVTFHPPTLDDIPVEAQFEELAAALRVLGANVGMVITQPNADAGGRTLDNAFRRFVENAGGGALLVGTLGQRRYVSLMREVDAVVGNSSSGVLEAPFAGVPTVDIGDRQKGRPRAESVINCPPRRDAILQAIERAFTLDCGAVHNPFGDGHAAERIVDILVDRLPGLTPRKAFVDMEAPDA
jgi:UDP-N-acetylglucosamine 2-epimerase (non-hydrolysing)/GDP/UDP-N,N'-diacetylbacillosamine 2-epimerase (hydrolysing)